MRYEAPPGRRAYQQLSIGADIRASSEHGHGLNLVASLHAAVARGARLSSEKSVIPFLAADVRRNIRRGKEANLIVFLVDASGSMAARDRLSAVVGAVSSLLSDAYRRRDKVAVISVRGKAPELLLAPTSSIDIAQKRLQDIRTGGRTPLEAGLALAHRIISTHHLKEPGRRAILVVLSDGRATGKDAVKKSHSVAAKIAQGTLTGSIVIDCEAQGRIRLGLAQELARHLAGECIRMEQLSAQAITRAIDVF
ncbi:VWA domain-containing protein [Corynebacterium sp. sy017]|uniref:vWA domain-containing protein n=1 Tax=unclassified Corynebacterium TaxID=2624378 RepID=UPI0011863226|nr:VWA domain-containing protein [Corynebacterium sp. sy017]QDZ42808.1 VWA domain-containing protein [Corynebacterium sp. sy039]TSD92382.1 VWA domain-containing protein [Corynebacterium sp. SY003]